MDLSEVPASELMAELKRRLECQDKPEKRIILIGSYSTCHRYCVHIAVGYS